MKQATERSTRTPRRRRPTVLYCDRCRASIALAVDGYAYCLPCGRRMKPATRKGLDDASASL